MEKLDLSLILACYNEGPTLDWSLNRILGVLNDTKLKYEIICIDDKSRDNTLKTLQKISKKNPKIRVINHQQNVGRGGTVAEGIYHAKGKVVGFIDVDLETSPIYIPEFVRVINDGSDLAIATRIEVEGISAFTRWIASQLYVLLVRFLLRVNLKDTEAGYKFFNREKILSVLKTVEDKKWFFDTEIVVRSQMNNLKIKEIPVIFIRRPEKKSTVNLIPDSMDYFKKLIIFKFKSSVR